MKTLTVAIAGVACAYLAQCSSGPCQRYCGALEDCGELEDASGCIEACELTLESGGKDGQTDCAEVWETAGRCIEESSCDSYDSACSDAILRTDLCE